MGAYDVIVIGAGINGSATAYELSQRKKKVLLLEQFPLPHSRGSSHGQTRIIRCLYAKSIYAKMTLDAIPIWKDLEKKVNDRLLIQNGLLQIYENSDVSKIETAKKVLEGVQSPYRVLSTHEINKHYKPFHFEKEVTGLLELNAGTLMASKSLATFQKLYCDNGGELNDNEQVLRIVPGNQCTVITNKGEYLTKSIVITAGPFVQRFLDMLDLNISLKILRTHICFWKLLKPNEGTLDIGFPSFIARDYVIYGVASFEYPGLLKICRHDGPTVDIDYPDQPPDLSMQKKFIQDCMKEGVEDKPSIIKGCLYTCSPDNDFILDVHPRYPNIVIGTGFSGTGFKMSPITGKVLASLALGEDSGYDLSTFKINRFPNVFKINSNL